MDAWNKGISKDGLSKNGLSKKVLSKNGPSKDGFILSLAAANYEIGFQN